MSSIDVKIGTRIGRATRAHVASMSVLPAVESMGLRFVRAAAGTPDLMALRVVAYLLAGRTFALDSSGGPE